MELELVVLAFTKPSDDEVNEFAAAARAGDFDKVCALSEAQRSTPHSQRVMRRQGLDSFNFQFPTVFPDFR